MPIVLSPPSKETSDQEKKLLDAVFGDNRHQKCSYFYRKNCECIPELSRVAWEDARLVGTIRYWPVEILPDHAHLSPVKALLLGPLGVAPDRQRAGVGQALIQETIETATSMGFEIILLVGPLHYYSRFGFQSAVKSKIFMPGEAPEKLLVRAAGEFTLNGVSGKVTRISMKKNSI